TSGSGARIGTGRMPTNTARGATRGARRGVRTPANPACRSGCSGAARSSAATSTARATCRAGAGKQRSTPAPRTPGSGACAPRGEAVLSADQFGDRGAVVNQVLRAAGPVLKGHGLGIDAQVVVDGGDDLLHLDGAV